MTTRRATSPGGLDVSDGLLLTGCAVFGVGLVLWLGAAGASLATGHDRPVGGVTSALRALANPGDPAVAWSTPERIPTPPVYWLASALVSLMAVSGVWFSWRCLRGRGDRPADVRRLPGLASTREALRAASRSNVLDRAALVRPSLSGRRTNVEPEHVGYRLGSVSGRELWCTVEDSVLLVGPPRMGKGLHVVVPWVLDAPGAVVATSTRPDTLAVTLHARAAIGPVAIFDPQQLAGLPNGLRWSPVRGCESPRTALVRARGLAAGAGFGKSVSDSEFWSGQTETALRCLLHAAALDGRGAADLYRWSLNPALAEDAVTVLNRSSSSAPGWAAALDAAVHADPRTRDSVWLGVRQSLAALADPDVLAAVEPREPERFDPTTFLQDRGSLFLLASAVTSASSAPLIAAFVEDITETARLLAARSPGARLDPPLLLALDEIANLTPLPSLPSLMAEGGGTGITTLAVLQSLAQARHRWGEHAADTIWDAATVKLVLGGLAKARDLEDVARLLGEIDEPTRTTSRGACGERSSSFSMRNVPVMPPAVLRTLPFGTGVLLLRQTRPLVLDLKPWTGRRDSRSLVEGRSAVERASAGQTELSLTLSRALR